MSIFIELLREKDSWADTFAFFDRASRIKEIEQRCLEEAGREGVEALKSVTPVVTGRLASSWFYKIVYKGKKVIIEWHNDDIENGINIALLVRDGHGTRSGHYIAGKDYISAAIEPLMDSIAETVVKEVNG